MSKKLLALSLGAAACALTAWSCIPLGNDYNGTGSGTGGARDGVGGLPNAGAGGGAGPGTGGGASGVGGKGTGGVPDGTGVGGGSNGAGGRGTGGAGGRGTGGGMGGATGSGGRTGSGGVGGMIVAAGTGGAGTGGASNVNEPPRITSGGSNGWASRYWDCCKPACGWTANVHSGSPMASCNQQNMSLGSNYTATNACQGGGTAYMCWNAAPWSVSPTLSYGFAAASGGNYVCGRCYQLQFTGSGHSGTNAGATSLSNKTVIAQVINNGGVAADQFDLLIPGGGVGALNACSTQWGTSDLGSQYGGFLAGCNGDTSCVKTKCQTVFADKPDLMAGCDWFLTWFNAADNPNFVFKQIACPSAITQKSGLQDPG